MFDKFFETLFFTANDPASLKKWRLVVSLSITSLTLFAIWALGVFSNYGSPGFAYAGDLENRVVKLVQPLKEEQAAQRTLLANVSEQLKDTLAEGKAAEIRAQAVKRCKTKDESERETINREIDRKQAEFFRLESRYYLVPDCGAL